MEHVVTEQQIRDFAYKLTTMTDAQVLTELYKSEVKKEFGFILTALVEVNRRGINLKEMQ